MSSEEITLYKRSFDYNHTKTLLGTVMELMIILMGIKSKHYSDKYIYLKEIIYPNF